MSKLPVQVSKNHSRNEGNNMTTAIIFYTALFLILMATLVFTGCIVVGAVFGAWTWIRDTIGGRNPKLTR